MKLQIQFHNEKTALPFIRAISNWTHYTPITFRKNNGEKGYSFILELDASKIRGFSSYLNHLKEKGAEVSEI